MKNYRTWIEVAVFVLIIAGVVAFGEYRHAAIAHQVLVLGNVQATTTELFRVRFGELSTEIQNLQQTNANLSSSLQSEQTKSSIFEEKISQVSQTVGTISKLSSIDPQLLGKYSKVFFLNEHYVPAGLVDISPDYRYPRDKAIQFYDRAYPFLEHMILDARKDGITLTITSAYRSYGTQSTLKAQYKVLYGAGTANKFSADQGYSEHQLGTTVDISTPSNDNQLEIGFENTPAFKWLENNAYRYGFIMSYPKGNAYYQYEPWHWRFVGVDLANRLHRDGKNFYDINQRVIDNYLLVLFD